MTIVGEAVVVVKADARGFDKGLEKNLLGAGTAAASADKDLKNFSSSSIGARRFAGALTTQAGLLGASLGALGVGGAAAIAAGAIGSKLVGGIGSAIQASSNLEEQQNKVRVVFGASAEEVLEFGENASSAIGQSNRQALEAAGTFGNLFRAIGITESESAKMSTRLTTLASDLASFNNVPVDEALQALRSGLVGEVEPLRKFGVQLSEVRLKQEAMAQGLKVTKEPLDAAAKSQAAYGLILKDTGLAQGDYLATQDSLANSSRGLKAAIEDVGASLGDAFTPSVAGATGGLKDFFVWAERSTESVGGLGNVLKNAIPVVFLNNIREFISGEKGLRDAFIDSTDAADDQAAANADLRAITQKLTEDLREETAVTEDQQKVMDEAIKSQLDLIKVQRAAQDADREFAESVKDVSEAQKDIGITAKEGRDGILDAKRAVEDSKQAYQDAKFRVQDLTDALEDQRKANERLKESVPRAEFDLTRAREGQTSAVDDLKDAEVELKDLRRFVETTPQQLQEAEEKVRQARLGVTQASFGTQDAEQKLADLRAEIAEGPERIAAAEREIARGRQALIDQGEAVKEAERGVGEARTKAASDSAAANERLGDAQRRVEDSAFGVAAAAVELAREQAEANGKTFTAAEANVVYKEKLDGISKTLSPEEPLRLRLREYAKEIQGVAGIKSTVLKLDTKDANKKLDNTQSKIDKLIEGLTATTTAAVGGDAIGGGIEGATISIDFNADIEGTAKAVAKQNGGAKR